MGFAWNSSCYQDSAAALSAFARDIPSSDSAGINAFVSPPTITPAGLITWSISNRAYVSGATTVVNGSTQLQTCTDDMGQYPVQSILVYLAFAFAAFNGFQAGFRP